MSWGPRRMVRDTPSFCRTQRLCTRSLSTCWVSELCPLQSDMGGMEPARGPGWEPAHSAPHRSPSPSVPTPTDVSQLTDTICGVGNMSANASVQERTPWHVTIKVSGRRERAWTQRWKRPGSRDIAVPEYHLFSCSLRARRPAGGLSSQTSGS